MVGLKTQLVYCNANLLFHGMFSFSVIREMDRFDSFPTSLIREPTASIIDRELAAVMPSKTTSSDVYVHAKASQT